MNPWTNPNTVDGFRKSPPNATLIAFAAAEFARIRARGPRAHARALDIGCGAARNAAPLVDLGWDVLGLDLSEPMLRAARERARFPLAVATMDALPAADDTFDLIIAHGIWNLAQSGEELRRAMAEAARVAKPGAALFVFTFSRTTLSPVARPVDGEAFVFTEFSGNPQVFLTEQQLLAELHTAGFEHDPSVPLTEHNRLKPGPLTVGQAPVIWEALFRRWGPAPAFELVTS